MEKSEGTISALRTSPLSSSAYIGSKVLTLATFATVESAILTLIGFYRRSVDVDWPVLFAGVVLLSVFQTLIGLGQVVTHDSSTAFLIPDALVHRSRRGVSMPSTTAILGMLWVDGLRLARDRFLVGTAIYIIALSIGMRWLLPWVTEEVAARLAFDLAAYHAVMVSHMIVVLTALTAGFVGGFLLLAGREDRTVKAQLVTPVPLVAHVVLVSLVLALAAVMLTLVEGAIIGLALPPWPALVAIACAGAPAAPLLALFIASFADNKVEAFAYSKFAGVAVLIPAGAFFVPEPWQCSPASTPHTGPRGPIGWGGPGRWRRLADLGARRPRRVRGLGLRDGPPFPPCCAPVRPRRRTMRSGAITA